MGLRHLSRALSSAVLVGGANPCGRAEFDELERITWSGNGKNSRKSSFRGDVFRFRVKAKFGMGICACIHH